MYIGLLSLCFAYVLSQFFRAFLAVIAQSLQLELGIGAETLAQANGYWFLSFALMQIPVGWALDRIGPRKTASVLLGLGGVGGSVLFASANSALQIHLAMILIGIGCAPVLMAGYFIFARQFEPKQFATLAASMIGVGTLGNLLAAYPMTFADMTIGWRNSMYCLAVFCAAIGIAIFVFVKDPEAAPKAQKGSFFDLFRIPTVWLIMPIAISGYLPAAAIRGAWMGPYLADVHGLSASQIGAAALVMGIAMTGGVFAYGPLDRWFGTRKWVVIGGNLFVLLSLFGLYFWGSLSAIWAVIFMSAVGFFGATFPVIMAHGKGVFPISLTGRGVTLLNMFSIGGVGLGQFVAKKLHSGVDHTGPASASYDAVFLFFALLLATGVALYALSEDNVN